MSLNIFYHLVFNLIFDLKQFMKKIIFHKPKLKDKRINSLRRNGFLKLNWSDIFNENHEKSALFKKIKSQANYLYDYSIDAKSKDKDKYVIFGSKVLTINPDPHLVALGHNKNLIKLINGYFEKPCHLYGADYWLHKPSKGERFSAQLWHRDPEGKKIIKLFLIIKDVGLSNGPTEFIKQSHRTSKNFFLRNIYRNKTNTPSNVCEKIIKEKKGELFISEGKSGDIILLDTSGFHRGGYCEQERLIANLTYF